MNRILVGRHSSGVFDDGAAEIVACDPAAKRLLVANSSAETVDELNLTDPPNPVLFGNEISGTSAVYWIDTVVFQQSDTKLQRSHRMIDR